MCVLFTCLRPLRSACADTPADALVARKNGAQGIGLVRTGG